MQLTHPNDPDLETEHLSVDGMSPQGPNLSHWPGNRTPRAWKRDLSTGICLAFRQAAGAEQAAFLGGVQQVLNDHYDSDGFGSLLTILKPELAMEREVELLAAAQVGDFQMLASRRGFAVDRSVLGLAHPESPFAPEFAGLDGADLDHARYRWLIQHAEMLLDLPDLFAPLWREELGQVEHEIDEVLRGSPGHLVQGDARLGFATVYSPGALHRMTLNTVAGAWRVLHAQASDGGWLYRYHDRTESWFELVSFHPLPRIDLRPLAQRLNELDPDVESADAPVRWVADPPDQPVPELYRGIPAEQEYGQITRELRPSRLEPSAVQRVLREAFNPPQNP